MGPVSAGTVCCQIGHAGCAFFNKNIVGRL